MKDGFRIKDVIACAAFPGERSSWRRRDKLGTSGDICGAADGGRMQTYNSKNGFRLSFFLPSGVCWLGVSRIKK
jgi:hypothetical protein